MTDIVERLHKTVQQGLPDRSVLVEAAAEIERLKADKDVQRSQDRNAAYEADIEKLKRRIYTLEGLLGEANIAVPDFEIARAALEPKPLSHSKPGEKEN